MSDTDIAIRALKPGDKPYTVSDSRGLYVEVFSTGGVVWRYRDRLGGKSEKLTLGKHPALTQTAARLKPDDHRAHPGLVQATRVRPLGHSMRVEQAALRGVLKRLFGHAVTLGLIQANPVLALPMWHGHKSRSRDRITFTAAHVTVTQAASRAEMVLLASRIAAAVRCGHTPV